MAKLKIVRCTVSGGQIREERGAANTFEVTINPESYSHSFGITYSGTRPGGDQAIGKAAQTPTFANTASEKVAFKIVIDATGVVPDNKGKAVAQQIDQLRGIVYEYDGETHEPGIVKITWGKGLKAFFGRLEKLGIDYTLFHPDGTALRAKLDLGFISAKTPEEEARLANRQSPDMTHVIRVRAGDTLPLLCQRVYGDPSKYIEVARLNELDGFRTLAPDTLLRFPPMR